MARGSERTFRELPPRIVPRIIVVGSIVLALVAFGLQDPRYFRLVPRAEFNPVDYLESDAGLKFRSEFAPALFMEKLHANEFLCVDEKSDYFPFLTSHNRLTGIEIDADCEPLDLTDRPGDSLHPQLVTESIAKTFLYWAHDPDFTPTSNRAVLVEAHGGVFVLVNESTLEHLGISLNGIPR